MIDPTTPLPPHNIYKEAVMRLALPTTNSVTPQATPRRGRAIAAGAALLALMLLAVVGLALAPTPAYAAGDLFRLNADVTVGPAETYKSVVVMNGTIVVDGHVVKDAFAANGDIIVHDGGSIGGDAVSLTGKVITEGGGTIGGDRIEVASGAVGSGGVSSGVQAVAGNFDDPGFGIGGWIALTLGALGVGLLLVLISGGTLHTVGREISERTGRTVLVGFLALIGVPVVFVVLLISIIGIPVALLLILLVPLFSLYGMFALALVVGERLLATFDRAQTKDVWAIVAGVLLISVIRLIPVLGWIAFAVAGLAGFGAAVSRLWDYFQQRRAARPGPGQALPPYPMDPYPAGPYPPAAYPPAAYPPAAYPPAAGYPGAYPPAAGYPGADPTAFPAAPVPIAEGVPAEGVPAEPEAPAMPVAPAPPEAPAEAMAQAEPEAAAEPEGTPAEPAPAVAPEAPVASEPAVSAETTAPPEQPSSEPRFHI